MKNSTTFCFTLMTIVFNMWAIDFLFELQCSTHLSLLNFILLIVAPLLQLVNIILYLAWFCHPEYEVILPSSESFPVRSCGCKMALKLQRDDKCEMSGNLPTLHSVTVTFVRLGLFYNCWGGVPTLVEILPKAKLEARSWVPVVYLGDGPTRQE